MLKITTLNGTLKTGENTSIAFTNSNPLFNERGSGSLPFSIPITNENLDILGISKKGKFKSSSSNSIKTTIEFNSLKLRGSLFITDIKDEIELEFIYDTSDFWYWAKNTKLRDVTTKTDKVFHLDATAPWQYYFDKIWPEVEMAFGIIAIKKISDSLINYTPTSDDVVFYCGNELIDKPYYLLNNANTLLNIRLNRITDLTGFLYVREVIQWIINTFGTKIEEDDFDLTPEMNTAIILNACTQPFRDDITHFNEMLPSGTVLDFIESIEKSYGCLFYYDSLNNSLYIKYLKKQVNKNIFKILTNSSINSINHFEASKQIKLISDRIESDYTLVDENLTEEELIAHETFEEVTTPYEHGKIYKTLASKDTVNYPEKIVFSIPLQAYFSLYWVENGVNYEYTAKLIKSRYENYDPKTSLENQTIETKSKFAPMVSMIVRQFFIYGRDYESASLAGITSYFDYEIFIPQFNAELQQFKSNIFGENFYDWNIETPISFAFYRGIYSQPLPDHFYWIPEVELDNRQVVFHNLEEFNIPWCSTDVYTKEGEKMDGELISQPNLYEANIALRWIGDYGLYSLYYKELEQLYLKSLKTSDINLLNDDFSKIQPIINKVMIENAFFFINQVKFTLYPNKMVIDECSALTTKPYS